MSEREVFLIPDSGKIDVPFGELHFWKWLDAERARGSQLHHLYSFKAYLESVGFDRAAHRLPEQDVALLRTVMNHYGWLLAKGV